MPKEIPIRARDRVASFGDPWFRTEVELLGETYVFDARWNSITEAWYLDVFDVDLEPIRLGLKLVLGVPIGWRTVDDRFPGQNDTDPGLLIMSDLSGQNKDPGFDELGGRCRLYFLTNAELESEPDALIAPDPPALFIQPAPVDGPDLVFVPETSTHWANLGIPTPTYQFNTQIAAGAITALIGAKTMSVSGAGSLVYQDQLTGWDRVFCGTDGDPGTFWTDTGGGYDIGSQEHWGFLVYIAFESTSASSLFLLGSGTSERIQATGDAGNIRLHWEGVQNNVSPAVSHESVPVDVIHPFWVFSEWGTFRDTFMYTDLGATSLHQSSTASLPMEPATASGSGKVARYGPVMAFWIGADAQNIVDAGLQDRTMLETLGWKLAA